MAQSHSSQGFVRALKAHSDPPAPGGPFKIEIARQAWDDFSFYVPSKAEVIVDWILSKFLKEKAKEPPLNPILDLRLWTLLYDVISSSNTAVSEVNARSPKTWLPTLLNRIPVAPILASFLQLFSGLDSETRVKLSQVASSCLEFIWPLSVQKLSTEAILETFGAFVGVLRSWKADESLLPLAILVTSSYRNSLSNSSNKKKVYAAFLQNHLHAWLDCVMQQNSSDAGGKLLENLYIVGVETVFSLDIMRQAHDSKSESSLLEAIASISSSDDLVLGILPRIFTSYIEALRRHRGVLFSQGSDQVPGTLNTELNSSGMQFFASCLAMLNAAEQNAQVWVTRVTLLSLVDEERLFNRKQLDAELVLSHNIDNALKTLDSDDAALTALAIESLSVLTRIDYDLVIPKIPRILPKILAQKPSESYSTFLHLLLTYHTKTRNMDTYIDHIFSTFSSQGDKDSIPGGASELYQKSLSGPFFKPTHLGHLSKANQTFLAGSQIRPTIDSIFTSLKTSWEQFDSSEGLNQESARKKRKLTDGTAPGISQESWAVAFSLSSQFAATVFALLPMHSVPINTQQDLCRRLNDIRAFTHRIIKKALKTIQKEDENSIWPYSIVAAGALRLHYALDASGYLLSFPLEDSKYLRKISQALQDDGLLPELRIEIIRALLAKSLSREVSETRATLDVVLHDLEKYYKISKASWSGQQHYLSLDKQGRRECALASMHMIVERWLPMIESFASQEQLGRLVRVIVSIDIADGSHSSSSTSLQTQSILIQTLQSAQFWELPNLRNVLLEYLNQTFAAFGDATSNFANPTVAPKAMAAYRLLLLVPVEYLSRTSRIEFTRRALIADQLISSLPDHSEQTYHLMIIRIFLKRVLSHARATESIQELYSTLNHLVRIEDLPIHLADEGFIAVTMDLIESLFSEVFRVSEKADSEKVLEVLRSFDQVQARDLRSGKFNVLAKSFIRMVGVLEADFSSPNFPRDVISAMHQLHKKLSTSIFVEMSNFQFTDPSPGFIAGQNNVVALGCSLLSFGKWLALTDTKLGLLGKKLILEVLRLPAQTANDIWNDTRISTFAILLQELHYYPESDRVSILNFTIAVYLSFSCSLGPGGRNQMDNHVSKVCKLLTVSEFSHILDLLSESLTSIDSSDVLTHLVHLSGVLLRDHPKGTLKHMQTFSSQCMNTLAGWCTLIDGPLQLRLQTLEFVAQHCAERPAVLRLVDMGGIWILLSRFLAGSRVHDNGTSLEVFHQIIAIVSALIRLRRDLVALTLPHLGNILRQLMLTMRSVRPHLGAKQTALVTDTQPRWINAEQPIGVEEAKALARLLETLATKSMIRNNAASLDNQKAESLAKVFSKHAAYVIKAYIEAMNDPLCILPYELRRELHRSLYTLCGMVSDHTRDAMMMASLDAGGKITMKSLWKEYEKQRYVGKG